MSTLALHIANGDQNDYLKVETTTGCLGWSFDLNYWTQIVLSFHSLHIKLQYLFGNGVTKRRLQPILTINACK